MDVDVRRTYKFRLYRNDKRDGHLHQQMNVAGLIWNHALALQRRVYRLTRKSIGWGRLKQHMATLRMKTPRYALWQALESQAVQDVLERLDKAYQRFFKGHGGLPRFKKVKKYKSFTLKQAGWKRLDSDGQRYGRIQIGQRKYKFVKHRPLKGTIKTVTVKRDVAGRLWVCFSVIETIEVDETLAGPGTGQDEASTGQTGGFDFGLKTFLTTDSGAAIDAPPFYRQDLPRLRTIQSRVWQKNPGSHNDRKGRRHLARRQIRIADQRRDFHYQLAHDLCDAYDVLVFEDLNIEGMKHLWGRKVSDLGFAQFMDILEWVALKRGKQVVFIDRWQRTTGTCSGCGHEQQLELSERTFGCERCGLTLGRDHNAARNIRAAGHRRLLYGLPTSSPLGVYRHRVLRRKSPCSAGNKPLQTGRSRC